jgi:hypothetical protein
MTTAAPQRAPYTFYRDTQGRSTKSGFIRYASHFGIGSFVSRRLSHFRNWCRPNPHIQMAFSFPGSPDPQSGRPAGPRRQVPGHRRRRGEAKPPFNALEESACNPKVHSVPWKEASNGFSARKHCKPAQTPTRLPKAARTADGDCSANSRLPGTLCLNRWLEPAQAWSPGASPRGTYLSVVTERRNNKNKTNAEAKIEPMIIHLLRVFAVLALLKSFFGRLESKT